MKASPPGTKRANHWGYIQIRIAGKHLGKKAWPFEHRLVWESVHGPIPDGVFIHHLNRDKADNRLENLARVENNSEHHREYHADAHRERGRRVGLSGKGVPKSPEHRAKIGAGNRGKTKSLEHRAKLSAALMGRPLSPEHRAAVMAAMALITSSADFREKQGRAAQRRTRNEQGQFR